ncbi:MAG: hypothetical protein ACXVR9_15485 [Gaiellaceae bacterium]
MVLAFPNSHVHTQINPALLVAEIIVDCLAAGALGLTIGQLEPSPRAADLLRDPDPDHLLGCIY